MAITVDIPARLNTEPFLYSRLLTDSTVAYPLQDGEIVAQLRRSAPSPNPVYQWMTERARKALPGVKRIGAITLVPTAAVGFVAFTKKPDPGDTVTIGETTITFVASSASGLNVAIGADLDATMAGLAAALSASTDPDIAAQTYTATDSRLDIVTKATGVSGNAVALATTASGATASSASLGGGGLRLIMQAPQAHIRDLLGEYVYDVRFEDGSGPRKVLFGGACPFVNGVTRT